VAGISGTLALALVPLTLGRGAGWPPWTWIMLAVSVPAMAATVGNERRLAARGGVPLTDLSVFRAPGFSAGMGIAVAFMAFFTSSLFATSLLLQSGLGLNPLQAGLSFVPFCLAAVVTALVGRRFITRYGARAVVRAGCVLSAAGTALLAALLAAESGTVAPGWLVAGLGIVGAGNSMILTAYLGASLTAIRPDQAGAASGTLNTIQQFAGVAGLAGISTVFFAVLGPRPGGAQYARAAEWVLWTGLGLVAVMAALSTLLPRPPAAAVAPPGTRRATATTPDATATTPDATATTPDATATTPDATAKAGA
jgi:MFS family permease